ncbi:MAG: hypothetical protein F3741_08940 [Nitrospinae bacterium]|nr:hypothetical protein [Nitrospinota bacterium]MZH41849.1 hypothetical protein [Nitrospinota bacterium]MZH46953.1 hypothetical protein [Nitrospinota bacterium]
MKNQKYLYKGRDFIKLRKTVGKLLIATLFSIALLFFSSIHPVFALDWSDNEWTNCPKTIEGTWVSEKTNPVNNKNLNVRRNTISITQKDNVLASGTAFEKKGSFFEMVLQSIENGKDTYFKIRPHLVQSNPGNNNKSDCWIKVFQFNSQAHAKFDKYSNWDIYQLKPD